MKPALGSLLVLFLLTGATSAQLPLETGDVLVYNIQPVMCTCPIVEQFAVLDATGALKASPELRATGLLAPAPDRLLASQGSHVESGGEKLLAGRGHMQLGELVETRAGHYLVAETAPYHAAPAVVRFTQSGEVLETLRLPHDARATHIELLSNQCMLLYTAEWHSDAAEARRVRKFNVCTGRDEGVLFSVPIDALLAGALRQLPGGDLLIATGHDVRRFNLAGHQLAIYDVPATHLALTPDASGFWAVHNRSVQRVDFANPDVIAVSTSVEQTLIGAVAVVGEWRAAVRTPAIPRRRAVR